MDRGAWLTIVHRVAKNQTQLKQLSTHTRAWASQVALFDDRGVGWEERREVQEEKGMTENEMVGWHHRLDGHGFG